MAKTLRGPIRAADLAPEIIDALEIVRDGETVVLRGYVSGRRCPSRVKAEVAAAVRDNQGEGGAFDFGAYLGQLRAMLLAVVIGLEDDEADILAGDDGDAGALAVLRLLGWWGSDATDEDDADPEAKAESSTSESSSPASPLSTDRTTG